MYHTIVKRIATKNFERVKRQRLRRPAQGLRTQHPPPVRGSACTRWRAPRPGDAAPLVPAVGPTLPHPEADRARRVGEGLAPQYDDHHPLDRHADPARRVTV